MATYHSQVAKLEKIHISPAQKKRLDQIAALVRSAIGFDANRGDTLEVVNMQFAEIEVSDTPFDNKLFGFDKNKLLRCCRNYHCRNHVYSQLSCLIIQPMVGRRP